MPRPVLGVTPSSTTNSLVPPLQPLPCSSRLSPIPFDHAPHFKNQTIGAIVAAPWKLAPRRHLRHPRAAQPPQTEVPSSPLAPPALNSLPSSHAAANRSKTPARSPCDLTAIAGKILPHRSPEKLIFAAANRRSPPLSVELPSPSLLHANKLRGELRHGSVVLMLPLSLPPARPFRRNAAAPWPLPPLSDADHSPVFPHEPSTPVPARRISLLAFPLVLLESEPWRTGNAALPLLQSRAHSPWPLALLQRRFFFFFLFPGIRPIL